MENKKNFLTIQGVVRRGHQIASGLSPTGHQGLNNTISLQRPHFEAAGVPFFNEVWNGTINLDISPYNFKLIKPDFEITCTWYEDVLETFWLNQVEIYHDRGRRSYLGYTYYPLPSAVKSHLKNDMIELLAPKIESLSYGEPVQVCINSKNIIVQ